MAGSISRVEGSLACDPRVACCEEAPIDGQSSVAATGTPVVTIPPVHIHGDAGAQELVRRFTATSPECLTERHVVADATESVGIGVATTIAGAATAWGAAAGLAATFHASRQTGEAVAALMGCEDHVLNRQEVVADCEARGGSVVSQTESEVECLVPAH